MDEREAAAPQQGIATGRVRLRLAVPLYRPFWVYVLLVANVLVWLAMTAVGGSNNPAVLVLFGAKYTPLIVAGQYWRLLSAAFVHIGITHLLFNAYALFSFGIEVERRFGRARFLALYLLSGIASTTASLVGNPALSAGASGAIFGLAGASLVYYAIYRDRMGEMGRRSLTSILVVLGLNLALGFAAPGIDNLGHIGGLIAGLALGWAYCPRYAAPQRLWATTDREGVVVPAVDRNPVARIGGGTLAVIAVTVALVVLGVWRWS